MSDFERWVVEPLVEREHRPWDAYDVIGYDGEPVVTNLSFREAQAIVDAHNASIARVEEALW